MATIFAPTYAALTIGYFDVHLYDISKVKWGSKIKEFVIENWSRFLDNCENPLDLFGHSK